MIQTTKDKREAFRKLHECGCFVMPNPWDAGSARLFQHMGFKALATTSTGYAWTTGRPDYALQLGDVLDHLNTMCAAVDLPVNADFESGFARGPEELAINVGKAIETGIAGLSIEDREADGTLFDIDFAAERIRAARVAIDRSGQDVILVARTESLLADPTAIVPTIDKLVAFAEAGADCLYAPGVRDTGDIAAMVRAVAPKPINVVMSRPGLTLSELATLGVRRVSLGGAVARVAWSAVIRAMEQIKAGSFDGLADGTPGNQLDEVFHSFCNSR
jgi:2-methylisocitrate lyase-like PEP mutase family enzyme